MHIDDVRNRVAFEPLANLGDSLDDVRIDGLFTELGWQMHSKLRLVAGARLTLLPAE